MSGGFLCLALPVAFRMICFVLQEVGYQHGKTVFDVWSRSGVVDKMLKDRHQEDFHNIQRKSNVSTGLINDDINCLNE